MAQYESIIASMDTCLSTEEQVLSKIINDYRLSKGLKSIPLSKQLTIVAKLHARDLHFNRPFVEGRAISTFDCNMHSWSDGGPWNKCCYTGNHKNSECMWDKPSQISLYNGTGYEIAYGYGNKDNFNGIQVKANDALEGWKNSSGHNPIIINKNEWRQVEWNAMGVAIFRDFAIVWFGQDKDITGAPEHCRK